MPYVNGKNGSALDGYKALPSGDLALMLRGSLEKELKLYRRTTLGLPKDKIYEASQRTAVIEETACVLSDMAMSLVPAIPGLLLESRLLLRIADLWESERSRRPAGEPFAESILKYARRISSSAAMEATMSCL